VTDPVGSFGSSGAAGSGGGGPVVGDVDPAPLLALDPAGILDAAPGASPAAAGALADTVPGGGLGDLLAANATGSTVLAAAAVIGLAGAAAGAAGRVPDCRGDARVLFPDVRLLQCAVRVSAERHAHAFSLGFARGSGAAEEPVGVAGTGDGGGLRPAAAVVVASGMGGGRQFGEGFDQIDAPPLPAGQGGVALEAGGMTTTLAMVVGILVGLLSAMLVGLAVQLRRMPPGRRRNGDGAGDGLRPEDDLRWW
jgi:hypothetical protein